MNIKTTTALFLLAAAMAAPSAEAAKALPPGMGDCSGMVACVDVVCEPRQMEWCGYYVCVLGIAVAWGWWHTWEPGNGGAVGVLYPGCPF